MGCGQTGASSHFPSTVGCRTSGLGEPLFPLFPLRLPGSSRRCSRTGGRTGLSVIVRRSEPSSAGSWTEDVLGPPGFWPGQERVTWAKSGPSPTLSLCPMAEVFAPAVCWDLSVGPGLPQRLSLVGDGLSRCSLGARWQKTLPLL